MKQSKIKVILVDDHQVLLDGLQLLLRDVPDIEVVGVAHNGKALLQKLAADPQQADLILMDIQMPEMDGIEATAHVKKKYPHIAVIMLTMKEDYSAVEEALAQGADGFISKNNGQKEIIRAVRKVYHQGELVIQANLIKPQTSKEIVKTISPSLDKDIRLTDREKEILRLLQQQTGTVQITQDLSLSTAALHTHLKILYGKLGVRTAEAALRRVVALELLPPK